MNMRVKKMGLAAAIMMATRLSVQATDLLKADNTEDLNLGSSWADGVVPGASDIAVWSNTVSAANTTVLGGGLTWSGIKVFNPGGAVTLGAGNTLTNGTSGIDLSQATQDLTLGCDLYLNGAQTLSVASGRTLTITGTVASSGTSISLPISGGGTVRWTGSSQGDDSLGNVVVGNNTTLMVDGGRLSTWKESGWGQYATGISLIVTNNALFRIPYSSGSKDYNMQSGVNVDISSGEFQDWAPGTFYLGRYGSKLNQLTVRGTGKLYAPVRYWFLGFQGSSSSLTVMDDGDAYFGNGLGMGDKTTGHYLYMYGGALRVVGNLYLGAPLRDGNTGGNLVMTNGLAVVDGLATKSGGRTGKGRVSLSGGRLMIGSNGIWLGGGGTVTMDIALSGGTVGAMADWGTVVPMRLTNDTGDVTFQTADTNDTPHNITLAGELSGVGGFKKTGGGTLTLDSVCSYQGVATVEAGTLKVRGRELLHRWSFNNSLADSVGGATATVFGSVTPEATQYTLAGGSKGTSYILLGSNLLPTNNTSATIELWATHNAIQNWSRILDFGSGTGNYLTMVWTQGTTLTTDRVQAKSSTVTVTGDNTMQPYETNTEYHISLVIMPGGGTGGNTLVQWYKMNTNGVTLNSGSFSTTWDLSQLVQANLWLGHSQYPDNDASASYNEVRFWRGALSQSQLAANTLLGPDVLPNGDALRSFQSDSAVAVNAGTVLDLDGGSVTLGDLSGDGLVTNGTLNTAGVIAPGGVGTIGTLTCADVELNGNGTLLSDVALTGECDLLAVQGSLDLTNMNLQIQDVNQLNPGRVYILATCTPGELTGPFAATNLPAKWQVLCDVQHGTVRLVTRGLTVLIF